MWKRREIAPKEQFLLFSTLFYIYISEFRSQITYLLLRSNFSSFPHYFIYIFLTSGVKLHIHMLNVVVQFTVFLTLSTLICRSTDISKYFSESLEIRDNESRLYIPNFNANLAEAS